MGAIRIQATIQEVDIPNVERFLREISAKEVSFSTDNKEFLISKELEEELEKRYENFKNNPEQGIFLEELKQKVMSRRYGI